MDTLRSASREVTSLSTLRLPTSPLSRTDGTVRMPSLEVILNHIGPLPQEALFLGQAEDDRPVLLNLHDPVSGPLLIVGREDTARTLFLKSIADFVILTHRSHEVQFGVITNQVRDWPDHFAESPHCVGVFDAGQSGARRFVHSLELWLGSYIMQGQSVLMLVDNFEELLNWDEQALISLRTVLLSGPKMRVWPIVTLNLEHYTDLGEWLALFQVKLPQSGLALDNRDEYLQLPDPSLHPPVCGPWFMLQEQAKWIRFWIPAAPNS